jgi:hypothetical protein
MHHPPHLKIRILADSLSVVWHHSKLAPLSIVYAQLIVSIVYPWAWVLIDGAHALPSDVAALLYAVLDFTSQVFDRTPVCHDTYTLPTVRR